MRFKSKFLNNFITVGLWTFISRIFGFFRDVIFAAFLGSGPIGEAFIIAFSLPNIFRRFFAEGALNAAFIPMFKKSMHNKKQAIDFANNTISMMILMSILGRYGVDLGSLLGVIFAPLGAFFGPSWSRNRLRTDLSSKKLFCTK